MTLWIRCHVTKVSLKTLHGKYADFKEDHYHTIVSIISKDKKLRYTKGTDMKITIKLVCRQRVQCEPHKDYNFAKYRGMFRTIYSIFRHRCPIFWKTILQYEISFGSVNRFYCTARLCVPQ